MLGCRTAVGGDVYTNKVGTFGVASVSQTSGHQPKDWAGRGYFFNTVGTHVFVLDFGGYVSEVVYGSVTIAAPYDDVAEVGCYSGTRVGPLVG